MHAANTKMNILDTVSGPNLITSLASSINILYSKDIVQQPQQSLSKLLSHELTYSKTEYLLICFSDIHADASSNLKQVTHK